MRILEGHAENRIRADLGAPLLPHAPRMGIMLHYDASVTDAGALAWLVDPRCRVGYNVLIWDNGQAFEIIDMGKRAPHAGKTRSSDPERLPYPEHQANSAFYGISLAATDGDRVALAQFGTLIRLCVLIFQHHGWPLTETWRLTSHHLEAWPRGRKVDVVGSDPANPVMDLDYLRRWLSSAR